MIQNNFTAAKQKLFTKLYCKLNEMQREAVFTVKGPLLVLAGAGSGKTTVLVNRIAQIIRYGNAYASEFVPADADAAVCEMETLLKNGTEPEIAEFLSKYACEVAKPYNVLCITFTNKAANEFKERLKLKLGEQADGIWAGTFHSICVRILRINIQKIGFSSNFTIYDSDDSKRLIARIMKDFNIDDKLLPVKSVVRAISSAKEDGQLPTDYDDAHSVNNVRAIHIGRIYAEYQKRLASASALDFDDIILNTIILFKKFPDVLQKYREKFDYVLVDEYQDTNPSQNELVIMIGGGKHNVCVVGDDDQSIYSFRGASVANILDFDKSFENLRIVKLEQNYRSTKNILDAANAVITNNVGRKGKELWTNGDEGEKINVKCLYTQSEESESIVQEITKLVESGEYNYGDFAILYRVNALSNSVESAFVKHHIPYRVYGGIRFFEHKEIKDLIAYLSIISNPDDNVRLRRIINVPKRQIGDTTINAVSEMAAAEEISMFKVIEQAQKYPSLARSSPKLERFCALISDFREYAKDHSISELLDEVVKRTEYREMILETETLDKAENVAELSSSVVLYEQTTENPSLSGFLEDVALVSDIDTYDDGSQAVVLMTVHSAKGLEFPVVFIPGFEDGVFPSQMAVAEGNLEEERRLAYVAITRAKKQLYISY
ncbi:MAG: 3'-5' exonuclease, partial [Clostridia bacterium]